MRGVCAACNMVLTEVCVCVCVRTLYNNNGGVTCTIGREYVLYCTRYNGIEGE